MFGSYYEADYYGNPVPYLESDIGEPVPGWGVNPRVAGPPRLGVGAINPNLRAVMSNKGGISLSPHLSQRFSQQGGGTQQRGDTRTSDGGVAPGEEEATGLPWWVYPTAAAVALGALGFYGTKKGWF
jgi:hypothetical protein